ncbi:hypothetical protein FRC03_001713 [Tulasnella sp. 419]|nr:hypothetical protein FRC03_001713 [Tulasnella sp. 419]
MPPLDCRENPGSTPFLLPSIVKELTATPRAAEYYNGSVIHSDGFHDFRRKYLDRKISGLQGIVYPVPESVRKSMPSLSDQKNARFDTWLHLAATYIDLPLALESIRLGQSVEIKSKDDLTPFATAINHYYSIGQDRNAASVSEYLNQGELEHPLDVAGFELAQLRKIIFLFVEHHADVNTACGPELSPLYYVAKLGDWGLVEFLLVHGASPHPTGRVSLGASEAKLEERLQAIAREHCPYPFARPPRLCPCLSHLPLDKCHGVKNDAEVFIPYPPYFLCPCDRGKAFEECCKKLGVMWGERWDEGAGIMRIVYSHGLSVSTRGWDDGTKSDYFLQLMEQVKTGDKSGNLAQSNLLIVLNVVMPHILQRLVDQGTVDPAFAVVTLELTQCPP